MDLLPHAASVLGGLDVIDGLAAIAARTEESIFFKRFGQKIFSDGWSARLAQWPQLSIHGGELRLPLADVVRQRLGEERRTRPPGRRCGQDEIEVACGPRRSAPAGRRNQSPRRRRVGRGCAFIRAQAVLPGGRGPGVSGVVVWRGTTVAPPFLTCASVVRAGWLTDGKMVIYPIKTPSTTPAFTW